MGMAESIRSAMASRSRRGLGRRPKVASSPPSMGQQNAPASYGRSPAGSLSVRPTQLQASVRETPTPSTQQKRFNQKRTQHDAKAQVTAMSTAVSAWESSTRASDPDFDVKAELVKDRVRAHMALHGMPANSSDALALTQSAYDTVTQTLRRVQGGRTAMRTAVGGKVNGSVTPEPKSLLDEIRRATAGA
jgi:hypothetical protein